MSDIKLFAIEGPLAREISGSASALEKSLQALIERNALGDRAGTAIDPQTQIVEGKAVCVVSCQRSPEPVFLKWKGMETAPEGDFFVRSGPGTVKLPAESAREYVRTRFPG